MEIILVSNNLIENELIYKNNKYDKKKINVPLVEKNKDYAIRLSLISLFNDVKSIYSSTDPSAKIFASYLGKRLNKNIYLSDKFNPQKNDKFSLEELKKIYFMQEHDFDIKTDNGESLNEVKRRINDEIERILHLNKTDKIVIYTHRRCIISYLSKYCKSLYNLEDQLILEYNDNIIYDGFLNDIDVYSIIYEDNKLININKIKL